jgi:hypothetical protein
MARIRTIKPEFWTNERVMECSANARLLFIGMWNFADDLGRLALAPKTIKAQIFPSDEISFDTIRGMIDELSKNGLLLIYEVDGKEYLQIVGWQHQRIDKPQPGKCPPPSNGYSKNAPRTVATDSILPVLPDPIPSKDTRTDLQKREGDFKQAIVRTYGECNSPACPDTSRAGLWLSQGYDPEICLAVIAQIVPKKPNVGLSYFDQPIAEAHTKKAPPRKFVNGPPPIDWDMAVKSWKMFSKWPKEAGNDPSSPACRAPPEILRKYGFEPVFPALRAMS